MKTVLVADDCQTDRQFLGRIVIASGHSPEYAVNGQDAISLAQEIQPQLILLDIQMPELDGFATCRKLKKIEETKHIDVIFVSARTGEVDRSWGMRQGASDYLCKPVKAEDISRILRRYL